MTEQDLIARDRLRKDKVYPILNAWDVSDALARIKSGIGHGSLAADILDAELEAVAEAVTDAILTTLEASRTPEGMVLVPREPTEAMIVAGIGEWLGHGTKALSEQWRSYIVATYRAMLSASPQPKEG